MRQIFGKLPWVHGRSHERFREIFQREGCWVRKKKGETIANGGLNGEVFWLERGLGAYVSPDRRARPHLLAFIPPGRLMGDVDGVTGDTVNMADTFLRPSESWLLERRIFRTYLEADRTLDRAHFLGIIADHESDMEALFAIATLNLDTRLRVLTATLTFADERRPVEALARAIARDEPLPTPYGLTITEMAMAANATRTAVSLCLKRWTQAGWLEIDAAAPTQKRIHPALWANLYDWAL